MTSHPGQLSLAILSWIGAISTSQRAVTPCGWELNQVWFVCGWQVKLCDSLVTHGPYLSALEIRSLFIKRYINSAVYFSTFTDRQYKYKKEKNNIRCTIKHSLYFVIKLLIYDIRVRFLFVYRSYNTLPIAVLHRYQVFLFVHKCLFSSHLLPSVFTVSRLFWLKQFCSFLLD